MAALPVGMQLVSALDDSELALVGDALSIVSDEMPHPLLLPLESDDVALDMELDVDLNNVFRPSALLDADTFGSESSELYFGSMFQRADWGDGQDSIEQILLCGSEETALDSYHQHETAPGKDCQCRNFAIRANRVQTQQERVVKTIVAKDQKRVLRHTFGKKLMGFGFEEGAVTDTSQQQDVAMTNGASTPALHVDSAGLEMKQEVLLTAEDAVAAVAMKVMPPTPFVVMKQEIPSTPKRALRDSRSLADDQLFSSPLHPTQPMLAVSSPSSTASFVSLEGTMATPLSTTSRSTVHPGMQMMRSLSPADELEKVTARGSKTSMHKMNILRGNFQVSAGRDTMPLVKPNAVLPPPYFRGALDSPEKRRVHSKTFSSFAQSLSFSFPSEPSTHR